ncbi:CHASE3 domain-containing protein [Nocardia alni]|uniref:CHASE3 domain-containing protein n=1 Tax=Nocardia alni TaxID=2815723 RepID=UPI001C2508C7|nr:CHASE3 domain-containing protein [Nocardia alni]
MTIVVIVLLFGISTVLGAIGRVTAGRSVNDLNNRVFVAQRSASAILRAYVDQETGQRGFLLTGDAVFLQPYTDGGDLAARAATRLRQVLADDAQAMSELSAVLAAAHTWETMAADPEIAARKAGPVPDGQIEAMALTGKQLFDTLRDRTAELQARTNTLVANEIHRAAAAQRLASAAAYVSVLLALLVSISVFTTLPRLLSRPVTRLLGQLGAVSAGDYTVEIERNGPVEIATIADAVNHMRGSILASIDARVAVERAFSRYDEQARLAADLNDRTITRVFALGLSLTSATNRHPALRPTLEPLIAETDAIIADLREAIYDLRHTDEATVERDLSATTE